jgi:Icc-related predicted phosphoesterase
VRFVTISDTHGFHDQVQIPDGDVLLVAGDITRRGALEDICRFNDYLVKLPHRYKIVIAGNHDLLFEKEPQKARSHLTNAIYLEDAMIEIEGIRIYGTPWVPAYHEWAFNLPRDGIDLKVKRDAIPNGIDILLTHNPPFGHGDLTSYNEKVGCQLLLQAIRRVKPRYHIFGDIHEGYGRTQEGVTCCINTSICSLGYQSINRPFQFELN